MDTSVLAAILTAVVAVIGSAVSTWYLSRNDRATKLELTHKLDKAQKELKAIEAAKKQVDAEHQKVTAEMKGLRLTSEKYQRVKTELEKSSVVRTFYQPVVLVGPREVGKTSLLKQWHAPWDMSPNERTRLHRRSEVPIFDFELPDREPHFADPDVETPVRAHLVLRVHDFPGELSAQQMIKEEVKSETVDLRNTTKKTLGVVLVCFFDALEAYKGVSDKTRDYYNGDLFRELRELISQSQVALDRLILVFNKYDLLRDVAEPAMSDRNLLELCAATFADVLKPLHGACNHEKICEVFTILGRDDMHLKNRGAPIVQGEAARKFVEAMAGPKAANDTLGGVRATNYTANHI